jgi:hypothetical protein
MATTCVIRSFAALAICGVMLALSSPPGVVGSDGGIESAGSILGSGALVDELLEDAESSQLVFDERDTDEDDEGRGGSIHTILRPHKLEIMSLRFDYRRRKIESRGKIPLV